MEAQKSVGEWNDYISNFLKATDVTGTDQPFVAVSTEEVDNRGERTIRLHLEANQIKFLFDLNKTNTVFIKNAGVAHPKDVTGKKLYFEKVRVMNPQTNREVDGLRICKLE